MAEPVLGGVAGPMPRIDPPRRLKAEHDLYQGSCSHTCEECGVTITVQTPKRPRDSSAARELAGKEIRRQVLWFALCPVCRAFWNQLVEDQMEERGKDLTL